MWNIMKAINYQVRRDNLTVYTFLFLVPIPFLTFIFNPGSMEGLTGSLYMANYLSEGILLAVIAAAVLSSRICGWDFNDKTINYELLCGHSRESVFFGRVLTAVLWSLLAAGLILFMPLILFTVLHGWGPSMELSDAVLRILLFLLPYFRQLAFFILLTFLFSNSSGGLTGSLVTFMASFLGIEILEDTKHISLTAQLSITNMMELLTFSNSRNKLIGGEEIPVYTSSVSSDMIWGSILFSVVMIIIYIGIVYVYFKKRDMS